MQEVLCVAGGSCLKGEVFVSGAKNAALPLIISTLLTREPCSICNVPDLDDINIMLRLLESLGAQASYNNDTVEIQTERIIKAEAPYNLVKALRASFWVLGPLIARGEEAQVSLPGGDAIGSRPVDLHLKGLAKLGADIRLKHGVVIGSAPYGLKGAKINLDFPSVGATHQLLLTAALIPFETIIQGAAKEPEIVDVANFLSLLGADIEGAGENVIRIRGRSELGSANYSVMGDRIEAATYLLSAAATNGEVLVKGIDPKNLTAVLDVVEKMGCSVKKWDKQVCVKGCSQLQSIDFETAPFPGVATDAQPLLMAVLTKANGVSRVTENVFENRFGHVAEYRRFGAKISVDARVAEVTGVSQLSAAPVEALDIRAAAGEVLMGLMADGVTQISEIYHLDRGYDGLVEKFQSLGARIYRLPCLNDREIVFGC